MPGIRLVDQPPLPPPRRRVSALERTQAADQLRQACATGRAVLLVHVRRDGTAQRPQSG
jgi:hypothetical protein